MKLKTYTASTMAQALAQVRKDLGSDAMILHTRSFRTGSWLGLGGKPMVEITASSPQPTKPRQTRRARPAHQVVEPVAQEELIKEQMPEIVVQRSRVLEPVARAAAVQDSASLTAEPMDDRAMLLQGLMGGVGAGEVSPIRDRRTNLTPPRVEVEPAEMMQEPHDDGFQATTFRTVEEFEAEPEPAIEEAVEETVEEAVEEPQPEPAAQSPVLQAPSAELPIAEPLIDSQAESVFEMIKPLVEPVPTEPVLPRVDQTIEAKPVVTLPATDAAPNNQELQSQIESLQKMMGQVLETTRRTAVAVNKTNPDAALPPVEMSVPLHAAYTGMIDNDVPVDLADRFVGAVRDRLDADELSDASVVRHALLREIEASIQTIGQSLLTSSANGEASVGQRPHVIALIGPTGVGKTTTVAKIAATAKLRHAKRVALITSDTYRIAAVEQLKTYASIIGLEIHIANTPEEMGSLIDSLNEVDLVVIDTAGRSQNNATRLDELGDFIAAAKPDETHLVLSSTVGDNVLRKTAERFMALGPDRCILTKLDEAVTTGMIAGINERIGLPLSFVTVGQEVPDDILAARSERLARAVLDGPGAVVPSL